MRLTFTINILLLTSFGQLFGQKAQSDSSLTNYSKYVETLPQKKYKFSKARHRANIQYNIKKTTLTFDAIYIDKALPSMWTDIAQTKNPKDTVYYFKRFFPTGEVFISNAYLSEPGENEANDLTYGDWQMFTIQKNGVILLETPAKGDFVNWYYYYLKTTDLGLHTYKFRLGRSKTNSKVKFEKFAYKKTVTLTAWEIKWK